VRLRRLIFVLCLTPLMWLTWKMVFVGVGANPVETINRFLGDWTLRFLLITLTATPLARLTGNGGIIGYRRMLGLFTFFYAVLHVVNYVTIEQSLVWADIIADVTKRRFITVGVVSFLMLVPLAVTSTNGMIRRLGAARWKKLHRLVYVAAVGGVFHYAMMVKADLRPPLIHAAILALLLTIRLFYRIRRI